MKRTLVFLALAGLTGVALAQSPPPAATGWQGGRMALRMQRMEQWRLEQLTVLLSLTPAQRQQVETILAEQHAAMRASMQEMMQAMRAMRQARLAARAQMMTKMAHVLNAEQMAKFKVLMPPAGMRGPMGPGGMGMRGPMGRGGAGMRGPMGGGGAGMPMTPPEPPAPPSPPQS